MTNIGLQIAAIVLQLEVYKHKTQKFALNNHVWVLQEFLMNKKQIGQQSNLNVRDVLLLQANAE